MTKHMDDTFERQIQTVLEDQRRELADIRRDRSELSARMSELDDEEITAIVGIRKTRAILEEIQSGSISEGESII